MSDSIVQRIWYVDEDDQRRKIEIPEGGTGYVFDNGTVRVQDPQLPSVTLLIPLHRVILIELREPGTKEIRLEGGTVKQRPDKTMSRR